MDTSADLDSTEPARPSAPSSEAEPEGGAEDGSDPADSEEQPVRTLTAANAPDPCGILTRADAAELLGQPVGPGRSPDAGGYPCVYYGEDGDSSLAMDMSLRRGTSLEDSALTVMIEHCAGEVVAEPEGLGRRAALLHWQGEDCGSDTLWVSTGVYFEGTEASEYTGRTPEGYIHFTFSLFPAPERAAVLEKLTTAAERALARLPEQIGGSSAQEG